MTFTARPIRKVLLLLRTDHGFARAVMRGVVEYGRRSAAGQWLFTQRLPDHEGLDPAAYDGIIAGVGDEDLAERFRGTTPPIVGVLTWFVGSDWPWVGVDDRAIGRKVASHLIERRHTRFAFVGLPRSFSEDRLAGFREVLAGRGLSCDAFTRELDLQWLRDVPKPAAVFAANDPAGQMVINQCHAEGIDVPAEMAVVGVDNDDLLCETIDPPLSSVSLPHRQIGLAAARRLDQLMAGEAAAPPQTRFPPGPLIVRRSSDTFATADPLIQRALAVIRTHLDEPIDIAEIARRSHTTRRTLARAVRKELGQTPLQLLHAQRLQRAEAMLIETDWPLQVIADKTGYRAASRLIEAFKRRHRQTPSEYRNAARSAGPNP